MDQVLNFENFKSKQNKTNKTKKNNFALKMNISDSGIRG